ncbi:TonB-dependent siderophore receptor [Marinobacter sp. 2_MG-2023]|uniref:TonB-dependent receptor plug domain-containing protein n=1 Tax=Marinobacter sp. 2_MG-2023 TaxID=3062679 RepID=UPI0026E3E1E7|nr:TonB-dependent receptor [Marinobacter sp. 2_MG-2023]MDO6443082.1 TonB-dependent receptor [Marinobacter sp. 2_MG-2023]
MEFSACRRPHAGLYPLSILAVIAVSTPLHAAGYLDELVVTGTRSERTVLDTPVRTEVVTAKEIENTHARNLKEALINLPGLLLREIHGKPGYEVWLQGIDADRVLVLVDGMPLSATTGSAVDVSQLAVLDIERIEVVKGAVSAQYGSAAMGGVVNVITRRVDSGIKGTFSADAGTYGDQNPSGDKWDPARYSGRAAVSAGNERWGVRLSGSSQHSDGIDPEPETWARPGDEYDRNDATVRLDWRPEGGNKFTWSGLVFDESSGSRFSTLPGGTINQGKDEDVRRLRTTLSGDHGNGAGLRGHWALLHEQLSDDTSKFSVAGTFDQREADSSLSQASGHVEAAIGDAHSVQVGTDLSRETLEQYKDGISELAGNEEFSREGYELWVQDTWFVLDNLELVTGLRGQRDSDFGTHLAPKINARLDFEDGEGFDSFVRVGVGSGYRVPNLKERHYRFDHSQLGYIVNGNPELEPESSVSYQLGIGGHFEKKVWFDVNGFFNDIDDLIQTSLDRDATAARSDNVQVYHYSNIDKARTWGLESTVGWDISEDWRVSAGYTWTETEDVATGDDLNRRPRHQLQASIDGHTGLRGLSWSVRARHQSSEYVDASLGSKSPAYSAIDLKFNYRLLPELKLFAGIDNLADTQRDFSDPDDFQPVAGRFLYTGFSMTLGSQ